MKIWKALVRCPARVNPWSLLREEDQDDFGGRRCILPVWHNFPTKDEFGWATEAHTAVGLSDREVSW